MKNFETLCSANSLLSSFNNEELKETVVFSDDLNILEECMKENFIILGLNPLGLVQLMPFFNAIIKAETI